MDAPGPSPSPAIVGISAYKVPRHPAPIRLRLDGNEGALPPADVWSGLSDQSLEMLRSYPSRKRLEGALAERLGVSIDQVLATNGGDDALDRTCRAFLTEGRHIILPEPTFEMLYRYTQWAGGTIVPIPWPEGPYPTDAVIDAIDDKTTIISVVSPNNPTGGVISGEDLVRLSKAAPDAVLLVDLAYVEFADEDLTSLALSLPNALIFRTFSKAWGMAGIRVGYVAGPARWIAWLRAAGNPYTVAGPSAWLASERLEGGDAAVQGFIDAARAERDALTELLRSHGIAALDSQANFVFARTPKNTWMYEACASLGIGIRSWPGHPRLADAVRITVPGNAPHYAELEHALQTALAPEAILLDMDGVIADVSGSYRTSIRETCAHYGVTLGPDEISKAKAVGDANNDWVLTQRLLASHGIELSLEEVTARFEAIYQGTPEAPGLKSTERLIVPAAWFEGLAERYPLGIVTGRPRSDAMEFLELHGISHLFQTVICMEDGPPKPHPAPVKLALERMGVTRAWLVGDTVDDVRAAGAAGVIGIGVVAPGEDPERADVVLRTAGAARVFPTVDGIMEVLP